MNSARSKRNRLPFKQSSYNDEIDRVSGMYSSGTKIERVNEVADVSMDAMSQIVDELDEINHESKEDEEEEEDEERPFEQAYDESDVTEERMNYDLLGIKDKESLLYQSSKSII